MNQVCPFFLAFFRFFPTFVYFYQDFSRSLSENDNEQNYNQKMTTKGNKEEQSTDRVTKNQMVTEENIELDQEVDRIQRNCLTQACTRFGFFLWIGFLLDSQWGKLANYREDRQKASGSDSEFSTGLWSLSRFLPKIFLIVSDGRKRNKTRSRSSSRCSGSRSPRFEKRKGAKRTRSASYKRSCSPVETKLAGLPSCIFWRLLGNVFCHFFIPSRRSYFFSHLKMRAMMLRLALLCVEFLIQNRHTIKKSDCLRIVPFTVAALYSQDSEGLHSPRTLRPHRSYYKPQTTNNLLSDDPKSDQEQTQSHNRNPYKARLPKAFDSDYDVKDEKETNTAKKICYSLDAAPLRKELLACKAALEKWEFSFWLFSKLFFSWVFTVACRSILFALR